MGNKRKYKVEIDMSGGKPQPILKNSNGVTINEHDKIIFNKDDDSMKKLQCYELTFVLDNPNQTNLRFLRDMVDVMWVHEDIGNCPDDQCALPGVLWTDEVDEDGEWVRLINADLVPQTFRFRINLADKNIPAPIPSDYVALDPIGENQDRGSSGVISTISVVAAIGTGVVVGLVTFAAAATFAPALGW